MTSFVKTLLRRDSSDLSRSPSFNDFSFSVGQDVAEEEALRRTSTDSLEGPRLESRSSTGSHTGSFKGTKRDVWQSVFNPGRNYHTSDVVGRSYFDTVEDRKAQPTTWDYICKSENVRKVAAFDVNNDGYVTADEVRSALGSTATIEDLIRKTDIHGDGRVAYKEFFDLIRES